LWCVALQQCFYGGALVGLQDIHSLAFPRGKTGSMSCQQVPAAPALNPHPRSVQVREFEVATGGGIWVAIRALVDRVVLDQQDGENPPGGARL